VVAHIARLLLARGERPAILSRGYARRDPVDGTTVVSDGSSVLAPVERSGDEPLMLARGLQGAPILVGADRYLSGRLAEERFGATVHILDDGFQHVMLERDVDLLVAGELDLNDRVLPAGRLRERLTAAARADALIVNDDGVETTERMKRELAVDTAFHMRRELGSPYGVNGNDRVAGDMDQPVLALAGIACPERFFGDLTRAGWRLAGTMTFRDHHTFSADDVSRIAAAARNASTRLVLTTEKDAARLDGFDLKDVTIAAVPLSVTIEPPAFADWLLARIPR
jgi:tetraacyldisaccharide 4'-kinase